MSKMMRWIANPEQGAMEQAMTGQVSVLHEQMMSALSQPEPGPEETQQNMLQQLGRVGRPLPRGVIFPSGM